MNALRLFFVFALLAGCALLAVRTPWMARAELNSVVYEKPMKEEAPFFLPPARPDRSTFAGTLLEHIDLDTVSVVVIPDRFRLFQRFAAIVIGLILLFGMIGYFVDSRPLSTDVAYALALPSGFLLGSVVCLLVSRLRNIQDLRGLVYYWAGGMILLWFIMFRARRNLPEQA